MDYFKFTKWQEFQHYKSEGRSPAWIKLYAKLLRNREFKLLTEVQQCHLFKLWLAGSQEGSLDPVLLWDPAHLKDLIYARSRPDLEVLEKQGFIIRCNRDGTAVVPDRYQVGTLEREGEREGEGEAERGGEDSSSSPETAKTPLRGVLDFDCDGPLSTWTLTQEKLSEWEESYPSLNVFAECKKARQWTRDNPGRRKTARGMTRFLSAWLARAQDRNGSRPSSAKASGRLSTGKERQYGELG